VDKCLNQRLLHYRKVKLWITIAFVDNYVDNFPSKNRAKMLERRGEMRIILICV
jgi:hypothetical protein